MLVFKDYVFCFEEDGIINKKLTATVLTIVIFVQKFKRHGWNIV